MFEGVGCRWQYRTIVPRTKYVNSHPRAIITGDFNRDHQLDLAVVNSNADNIGIFIGHENGTFANQQTYALEEYSQPYSIVTGDLNHDDKLDLIVANYDTHTIGILRGNGDGTFQNQTTFSTFVSRPIHLALNDFNDDTHLDLVVVNFGTSSVGVYLGDGNGSLLILNILHTGEDSLPSYAVIADVDRDHRPDIIVANSGTNNIGIFFNIDGERFTSQEIYSTGVGSKPSSMVVGDFNKDGWCDIAVTKSSSNQIGILFGNTNRTFVEKTSWTTNIPHPFRITTGDFNRDSREDLIVLYDSSDYLSVWLGETDGIFKNERHYFTGFQSNPYSVISEDFNHDHRFDVAIVNLRANNVGIFLGDNPISFQMGESYAIPPDSFSSFIAANDLNHDNVTDFVVSSYWNDSISIFLGSVDGTLQNPILYLTGEYSRPDFIAIADLNNDSHEDLMVILSEWYGLGVFLGYGNGTFAPQTVLYRSILYGINSIAVEDLNNDGRLDLVLSLRYEGDNIQVYLGYGNGSFDSTAHFSAAIGFGIHSVIVADMNRDGRLDIIAQEIYSSALHLLFGYGNGTFGNQSTFISNSGWSPCVLRIDDLNNDTFLDVLVAYCQSSQIGIYLGESKKTLGSEMLYSFSDGFNPSSIVVGDFNKDTRLDLVVTGLHTYLIYALIGFGDGTFSNPVLVYNRSVDDYPSAAVKIDLNHDHREDLIVVNYRTSTIEIFLGYDFGTLAEQNAYSTGSAPYPIFVEAADFNHDRRSDIAIVNAGFDSISVRLGTGHIGFADEMVCPSNVSSKVNAIVVGDFNLDTHLDIAAANFGYDNIGVFLGKGDGTFGNERFYSTDASSRPVSLVVGDFNNDNWTDIAVANYGTQSIGVFFAYNYTRLVYHTSYDVGEDHGPRFIVLADLNYDQCSDMVVVNYRGDSFSVFLGHRDGNFVLNNKYNTGNYSSPRAAAVGDFNHDDTLDLVITNSGQDYIMIYLGHGNGSFGRPMTYSTGTRSNPQIVCVSDLNNDDKLDIIVTNKNTHNILTYLGNGNGTFRRRISYILEVSANVQSMVVDDFNNDQRMDILFGDHTNNRLGLLLGYGNGSFSRSIKYIDDSSAARISINTGDFNNDTYLDIVAVNTGSNNIYTLLGYGNGSFSNPIVTVAGSDMDPTSVTVGDFNNDRLLDIGVSDSGGTIILYHGVGDGFFKRSITYTVGYTAESEWIVSGHFNTDEYLDVAVANFRASTVSIFFGNGSDPYSNQMVFPLEENSRPISLTVGDINNDHYADIIVVTEEASNVVILMNTRNESFSNQILSVQDFSWKIFSITVADLDNDTNLDLITVHCDNERISVFFGLGNGTFHYNTSYWIGHSSRPKAIALGDFTNDTYLDIAISNDGTNNIVLLSGDGNGNFAALITFSTGYNTLPCSLTVGDFNSDDVSDVLVVMSAIDTIGIISRIC